MDAIIISTIGSLALQFGPKVYRLYVTQGQTPQALIDSIALTLSAVESGLKALAEKRNKQDINDSVVSGKLSNDVCELDRLQQEYERYAV
jgi:hypothetical protein